MRTMIVEAYTPTQTFDGKPISEYELKRMPAPYKFGPAVAKFRKLPPTRENVVAHAEAISKAVLSAQRSQLMKEATPISPTCASGTWHTDGKALLKALAEQTANASRNALAESWRKRTDAQVGIALKAALEGRDTPLVHLVYT